MSTAPTGPAGAAVGENEAESGGRSTVLGWCAVLSVMMGIFVIVTAEILPIGLLTPVAANFGISDGAAGLMMTLPGLVAAVAAPLVTVTTATLDRRLVLCVLMLVLAASNAVCAAAPGFWTILLARVLVGMVIGGFWSVGAGLAGRLVAPRHVPRATALIFSAVPLGSVLGVPAGTFLGEVAGWRFAFGCLGVLTVAVLAALAASLPRLPALQVTRLTVLGELLRRRGVRLGLLATFLVVLAHFGTYTYVTPFLRQITHLDLGVISTLLLVYGAAGVVGNFIAGHLVVRRLRATFGTAATLIAAATLLLPVFGHGIAGAVLLLVVWGVGYGAIPVCSQTWIARCAESAEAATVLFTSSFQATIGVGAVLGGLVLDTGSVSLVMVCGAGAAGFMVVLVACARPAEGAAPRP